MQNTFLKILFSCFIVVIGLSTSTLVLAQQKESPQMQGEKLTRLWWENMQSKNISAVEKAISPSFQSIGSSGIVGREKFISIVKNLTLGKYALNDFKVLQSDNVLVISYITTIANEAVYGVEQSNKPPGRLDVWQNNASGWQIVSHADISPAKPAKLNVKN
jgi:hypothetical protein